MSVNVVCVVPLVFKSTAGHLIFKPSQLTFVLIKVHSTDTARYQVLSSGKLDDKVFLFWTKFPAVL